MQLASLDPQVNFAVNSRVPGRAMNDSPAINIYSKYVQKKGAIVRLSIHVGTDWRAILQLFVWSTVPSVVLPIA